jgi:very-short-patch-repair endonuclease
MLPDTAADDARVAASLDHWKRKLLDLSKRNRALNFKMTRVSTVAVVDERPAEVFHRLYLAEKPMRFRAAAPEPETAAAAPEPAVAEAGVETDDEAMPQAAGYAPYEAAALHEKHRDDTLQTSSPADKLDHSLRRIDAQAIETQEEQGVNTLFMALGMLHYRESADSDQTLRAPLVLLPVALKRASAAAGYTVTATDDDPIVNPALAEHLRRDFGVVLPELPDPATIADDYDLQTFFQAVTEAVKGQAGWQVTTEVYLGLFAFQKFVMYKDLEANGLAFGTHRLVRQLVTRKGGDLSQLPDDVRTMQLDADFPPERTAQVVDADGSQLRAIAAVARGHDLVLEGPPGTGKSQTITNLIAQALADGRSVLFVAEKMAALSVVHERLVRAGLGEFCLELHSSKANKRAVVKEIARAVDASLLRPRPPEGAAARLPAVRGALTAYAEAVHTPFGAAGFTPFRGFGELLALKDAPRVRLERPIDTVTREELDAAVRDLDELARAAAETGDPPRHPWRDSARTFWPEDDLESARALIRELRAHLAEAARLAGEVAAGFGLPPVKTLSDVDTAVRVAAVVGRSPGAPLAVLRSDAWNAPPREALDMVASGRQVKEMRERILSRLAPDVLSADHAEDVAFMEAKESSPFRFLNFLSARHRVLKRRWLALRLPGYTPTLLEQADEMKKANQLRRDRAALAATDATGRQLFGALWNGEDSDWDALEGYVRWVVEFRGVCVAHGLDEKAAELATRVAPDVSLSQALARAAEGARQALAGLRVRAEWPLDYLAGAPLEELIARAAALDEGSGLAPRWAAFEMVRQRVAAGVAGELVAPALAGEVVWPDLSRAFRRAFHARWTAAAVAEREPLRHFATLTHEQRAAEFRALDEAVLRENRDALIGRMREAVQARLREPDAREGMPFLQREMAKERRHAPLRKTLRLAGAAIRAIKPCFMMSPLTVAQLLDGDRPSFDLVIFDEASQLPSEDAVGAIVRGAQLVVVGDPKQLPPTNFFAVMSGQAEAPAADDGTPVLEDTESVLEEFMGAGVPRTRLRWHYRSTHESLITFSNVSFYDAELHTFPSVETATHSAGLVFELVPDGVYEGKGLNLVEARRVADEVVRHARETPDLSLGVGTFNLRQQLAIQDELELRRREDPSLEAFFARSNTEPFFVKNLENIQGDERDVILLSVTYARGRDGKLRHNFGPINGENGWRRLNVLTTRARQRMVVFASMRGDDINPAATTSRGAALLREFLLYAEHGRLDSATASAAADTDSPFEREVLAELTQRGLRLQPQVGVAGYRIDFGVMDDEAPGRYVCGIECDGVAYHSSETARDRDRLRQQVLERRGWEIHRIWSTDWFKDREGQIERILRKVEESRTRARTAPAQVQIDRIVSDQEPAEEPTQAVAPDDDSPDDAGEAPASLAATPYRMADTTPRHAGTELAAAPEAELLRAIADVAEAEAPLHVDDLVSRVAAMWDVPRAGSRMVARVMDALSAAERAGRVQLRGDFVWRADGAVIVRSRAGTRIPAERIAPEEYREAVLAVLRTGDGLPRRELTSEVCGLLGFSRTGPRLEEAVGAALDALIAEGAIGEGSTGVRLRA